MAQCSFGGHPNFFMVKNIYFLISHNFITYYKQFLAIIIFVGVILMVFYPNLRDLGVQLSSDLSFSLHIENIVTAVSRLAGWGLRRRSRSTMMAVLKTIIQPKLDYCSQLHSPSQQEQINKIESVQRHFTSKIRFRKH